MTSSPSPGVHLVLASTSPARHRLLTAAGIRHTVQPSGVPEDLDGHPPAGDAVAELAGRKAQAVAGTLTSHGTPPGSGRTIVLGCDSMLELNGTVVGKPATPEEAWQRWDAMRSHDGVLHTGHCIVDVASGASATEVVGTTVRFGDPTGEELEAYLRTGEPLEVAGAFTLDGYGAPFIAGVDGDPGNVVGLSLPALRRLLATMDIRITDLWAPREPNP